MPGKELKTLSYKYTLNLRKLPQFSANSAETRDYGSFKDLGYRANDKMLLDMSASQKNVAIRENIKS